MVYCWRAYLLLLYAETPKVIPRVLLLHRGLIAESWAVARGDVECREGETYI